MSFPTNSKSRVPQSLERYHSFWRAQSWRQTSPGAPRSSKPTRSKSMASGSGSTGSTRLKRAKNASCPTARPGAADRRARWRWRSLSASQLSAASWSTPTATAGSSPIAMSEVGAWRSDWSARAGQWRIAGTPRITSAVSRPRRTPSAGSGWGRFSCRGSGGIKTKAAIL